MGIGVGIGVGEGNSGGAIVGVIVVEQGFGSAAPAAVVLAGGGLLLAGELALVTLLGTEVVLVTLAGGIATVELVVGLQGTLVTPVVFVIPPVALPWFGN